MEGFPKGAARALVACVAALGLALWVVALVATPDAPWLQAAPGETVVLGLGPVALGDVLTGIVVAALVGTASLLGAWARRPIWMPAVVAWVVAPPLAARFAGAEFVMPAPLGHWHEILFAGRTLDIDALLALTWVATACEMLVVVGPAIWLTVRRPPSTRVLAGSAAVVVAVATIDIWIGEGLVVGPMGLVAATAGVGAVGWVVAIALIGWAIATSGPGGPFAAAGLLGGVSRRRSGASAPARGES